MKKAILCIGYILLLAVNLRAEDIKNFKNIPEVEPKLMALWADTRASLLLGDIEAALENVTTVKRNGYREMLKALKEKGLLKVIYDRQESFSCTNIEDGFADCKIGVTEDNGKKRGYPITFVLTTDGTWKLVDF